MVLTGLQGYFGGHFLVLSFRIIQNPRVTQFWDFYYTVEVDRFLITIKTFKILWKK